MTERTAGDLWDKLKEAVAAHEHTRQELVRVRAYSMSLVNDCGLMEAQRDHARLCRADEGRKREAAEKRARKAEFKLHELRKSYDMLLEQYDEVMEAPIG